MQPDERKLSAAGVDGFHPAIEAIARRFRGLRADELLRREHDAVEGRILDLLHRAALPDCGAGTAPGYPRSQKAKRLMETVVYLRKSSKALWIPENRSEACEQLAIDVDKALGGTRRGKDYRKEPSRVRVFTGRGQQSLKKPAVVSAKSAFWSGRPDSAKKETESSLATIDCHDF